MMSLSVFAQSTAQHPAATVNDQGIIVLPSPQEQVSERYYIDLSEFNFSDDMEMVRFFSDKSTDSYLVRAIPSMNKALVVLKCEGKEGWSCANWNEHLNTVCQEKPITQ